MRRVFGTPPSLAEVEVLAAQALATIPSPLRKFLQTVVIRVEEFCEPKVEAELDLDSPFDILGLYRGVSLPAKSVFDTPQDVDMILLYRRPILDYWCETGEDLMRVIRHVLIHEAGHHFGLSDEDMARIEDER
ncbi:MAG: metallopeptidase family protein [Defluviicoccus sp.]|nr:metallopeptidase family protein [Defluviicoccus sp.]MDG4607558.1 metallopeptidase family protein [Defluviicoccus sp.]